MKKGQMIIYIVMGIAVFAVLSIFMKPVRTTSAAARDEKLVVTGRSGYEISVTYADITDIEYRAEMDYGTLVDGMDDGKEKSGLWENDELGQYRLCVNTKVKPCIVLRVDGETMAINFESEA